jgi:hypothetical protein
LTDLLKTQIWCTTRRYRSRWTRSVRGEYSSNGNELVFGLPGGGGERGPGCPNRVGSKHRS